MNKQEISLEINGFRNPNINFLWDNLTKTFAYVRTKMGSNLVGNIIHTDTDNQIEIIMSSNVPKIFNQIYAIRDQLQPNRYFIGFVSNPTYTDSPIIGQIVYFDELGQVKVSKTLNQTLFSRDFRNGHVQTYLYSQSLVFVQAHRDTGKIILGLNLLDSNDNLLASEFTHTSVSSALSWNDKKQICRFAKITVPDNNFMLIDLGSLKQAEKPSSSIFKNSEKVSSLNINWFLVEEKNIGEFIENFPEPPEPYTDDYKANCIRCNKLTDIADWSCKNSYMGLGKSYCHACQIRYSATEKKWVCCQLNLSNGFCFSPIVGSTNGCEICNKTHSSTMKLQVVNVSEKSVKYPYKRTVNLTQTNI